MWINNTSSPSCGSRYVSAASVLVVVFIACAEVFSFGGTLTTNSFWFMLEEGSWVVAATIFLTPSAVFLLLRMRSLRRAVALNEPERLGSFKLASNYLMILGLVCLGYVPWGWTQDVPHNYERWRDEVNNGTVFLTIAEGIQDTGGHCFFSQSLTYWGGYLLWMTGYFSGGVWGGLALAYYAPRIDNMATETAGYNAMAFPAVDSAFVHTDRTHFR